ncbi:MAG: Gfo/Idh/MocA family oxidoreductase [Actinomycetota bacterium]
MVIDAVMIGAGQRGHHVYGRYAVTNPDGIRFRAVVDNDPVRLDRFRAAHPDAVGFTSVEAWTAADPVTDVAIIASPDRLHHRHALAALRAGHDVLLEKPMAATLEESRAVVAAAAASDRTLVVSHVLRYTPFFTTLNRIVTSGRLGDIVTVEHRENVSSFHMAHSFVRGNWSRSALSTPMIVQKCCHDFDVMVWNLSAPVIRLSSFGSLVHFRPERAPTNAADRCTDPCPVPDCAFDARQYLNPSWRDWPIHVLTDDLSRKGRLQALANGPYGRCVYTAGSDVVDQQVVTMELASGATAVLVMHGHSGAEGRTMRYDGTRATLRGRFGRDSAIEIIDHGSGAVEQVAIDASAGGHGGGDSGVMGSFLDALQTGAEPLTTAEESLESHVLAFAAEAARRRGVVVDVEQFRSGQPQDDQATGPGSQTEVEAGVEA